MEGTVSVIREQSGDGMARKPLRKGDHAPKVSVRCEECGGTFERSVVNPYIKKCPACRRGRDVEVEAPILKEAKDRVAIASIRMNMAADGSDEEWLTARREMADASSSLERALRAEVTR